MGLNSNRKWEVDNDFLRQLLTYNDGDKVAAVPELKACWSIGSGFSIVKGVLAWLTMRALNIERLPWMSDYPFTFIDKSNENALQGVLSYMEKHPAEIDRACEELKKIYNHTQSYYAGKTSFRLGRGYKDLNGTHLAVNDSDGFAKTVYIRARAAKLLGEELIHIPHDVITSWGAGNDYSGCIVGVMKDIPVQDILCSYETIAPREFEIQSGAIERGEFLVINRNWNGMLEISVEDVEAVNDFNIDVPTTRGAALSVFDKKIPCYREQRNVNISGSYIYKTEQSFKSRLVRAWSILNNKYQ